jgi:hypothetical protein
VSHENVDDPQRDDTLRVLLMVLPDSVLLLLVPLLGLESFLALTVESRTEDRLLRLLDLLELVCEMVVAWGGARFAPALPLRDS